MSVIAPLRDRPRLCGKTVRAFTLVELLVSMTVLVIIMTLTFTMIGQMSSVFKKSSGKIASFQDARLAFETITRFLSQATLNTYVDYSRDSSGNPVNYLRKSDLRFLIGPSGSGTLPGTSGCGQFVFFQAPASHTANSTTYGGMESLMNTCGFYVSFAKDPAIPAFPAGIVVPNPYRYRLMQLVVPTETGNSVYPSPSNPPNLAAADWTAWLGSSGSPNNAWFSSFTSQATPIADNIIALIIRPQDPSSTPVDLSSSQPAAPDYNYDSTVGASTYPSQPVTANQLPPVIQVTLVAIDEGSASQIADGSSQPAVITSALNNKFKVAADYTKDLANLESALTTAKPPIKYRIFSTGVPILETKWSK